MKGPVGSLVVVGNEGQDAGAQLEHRRTTESRKQATDEDREPDLNLVEPRTVFGSVDEANAMAGVGEKSSARAHVGEVATFAFATQVLLDATLHSHQTHQGLRLMRVELISNEDPDRLWVRLNGLFDVSGEVGFGARGSQTGHNDLPSGHLQVGNQTQGPMPLVFELLPLNLTGQHRQAGMQTLQGLNASHLIGAHHMRPLRRKRWGRFIDLTDRTDLLGQFGGGVGRWSEPIPLAMGLQGAHLLKNVPPCGEKSARQCHV